MQDTERIDPLGPPRTSAPAVVDEPPALFKVGVILIAGKALLWLCLLCLGWLAMVFGVGIGMANAHGDDAFALALIGVLGSAVVAVIGLFQLVVLLLAIKAWSARRPWVYVLMALAVLNVASGNPLGIAVGVVALIGCVQVLDGTRRL